MKNNRRKWIAAVLLVMLVLGLSRLGAGPIEEIFYIASQPFYRFFDYLGGKTSGLFGYFRDQQMLLIERDDLAREKEELLSELARLSDYCLEKDELAEVLGAESDALDWRVMMGKITYVNASQDWIMINLGRRDGVETGQPVITSNHVLAGRVGQVYERQAEVKLLSHADSLVKVKTVDVSPAVSFLQGKGGLRTVLQSADLTQDFKVGDDLVTDVFRDEYPANLLVGQIVQVERDEVRSMLAAQVMPFFDWSTERNLFILEDF